VAIHQVNHYDTNTLEGKMLHQVKQTTAERGDVLNNSRTTCRKQK